MGGKPGEGIWDLRNQVKELFSEGCDNCVRSSWVKLDERCKV